MKNFLLFLILGFSLTSRLGAQICVFTENDQPMPNVKMVLSCGISHLPPYFTTSSMTDSLGCMLPISNSVPSGIDCCICPLYDVNPLNGVTTFDLLLISRHILGNTQIVSPYRQIAADVNRSGSITANDIVELRKLILGIYDELPQNSSWRFVPKKHKFDTISAFIGGIPETVCANISTIGSVEFVGIKIGDVNNNAVVNNLVGLDDRAALHFYMENIKMTADEEYILPVNSFSDVDLLGFQMEFSADPRSLRVEAVLPAAATDFSTENYVTDGAGNLAISWLDAENAISSQSAQPLIFLKIKALQNIWLSDALFISEKRMAAEAYSTNLETHHLQLYFAKNVTQTSDLRVFPNPTSGIVSVQVANSTPDPIYVAVINAMGKTVWQGIAEVKNSTSTFQIELAQLPAGVYNLRCEQNGLATTRLFVKN